jgi:hypothetical protein
MAIVNGKNLDHALMGTSKVNCKDKRVHSLPIHLHQKIKKKKLKNIRAKSLIFLIVKVD